jgi:hypothetical protein
MRKLLLISALTAPLTTEQQTRREEVRSSCAAEDARANSPNVPDIYAIPSQFDRVLILRFKYETDPLPAGSGDAE